MSRRFYRHRQAYFPRAVPTLLLGLVVAETAMMALWFAGVEIGALTRSGIGLIAGGGAVIARVEWWKRKHPVLTPRQILDVRRRTAPWN